MRLIASVIEDAGDEEAGKHKEDINTGPAPVEVGVIGSDVVLEDDEKDRNGAQTIERRIETLILWRRQRAIGLQRISFAKLYGDARSSGSFIERSRVCQPFGFVTEGYLPRRRNVAPHAFYATGRREMLSPGEARFQSEKGKLEKAIAHKCQQGGAQESQHKCQLRKVHLTEMASARDPEG